MPVHFWPVAEEELRFPAIRAAASIAGRSVDVPLVIIVHLNGVVEVVAVHQMLLEE